jgi:hypothetical protein
LTISAWSGVPAAKANGIFHIENRIDLGRSTHSISISLSSERKYKDGKKGNEQRPHKLYNP